MLKFIARANPIGDGFPSRSQAEPGNDFGFEAQPRPKAAQSGCRFRAAICRLFPSFAAIHTFHVFFPSRFTACFTGEPGFNLLLLYTFLRMNQNADT